MRVRVGVRVKVRVRVRVRVRASPSCGHPQNPEISPKEERLDRTEPRGVCVANAAPLAVGMSLRVIDKHTP